MVIYIVKVTTNKEDNALGLIADKVKKKNINIFSIARPHGLRGYIFLESPDRETAEEAVFNLPYVKGIIGKTLAYEEIKNMIEPEIKNVSIEKIRSSTDSEIADLLFQRPFDDISGIRYEIGGRKRGRKSKKRGTRACTY